MKELRKLVLVVGLIAGATIFVGASPASATTYACPRFTSYEDWLGGARVHAQVSFRASDVCNGRHVRQAWVRIWRTCWPSVDSTKYTSVASSTSDGSVRSTSLVLFDSPVWSCVTHAGYSYRTF